MNTIKTVAMLVLFVFLFTSQADGSVVKREVRWDAPVTFFYSFTNHTHEVVASLRPSIEHHIFANRYIILRKPYGDPEVFNGMDTTILGETIKSGSISYSDIFEQWSVRDESTYRPYSNFTFSSSIHFKGKENNQPYMGYVKSAETFIPEKITAQPGWRSTFPSPQFVGTKARSRRDYFYMATETRTCDAFTLKVNSIYMRPIYNPGSKLVLYVGAEKIMDDGSLAAEREVIGRVEVPWVKFSSIHGFDCRGLTDVYYRFSFHFYEEWIVDESDTSSTPQSE